MRSTAKIATSAAAVAMVAGGFSAAASAQEAQQTRAPQGVPATLDGESINLGESWKGADVCEVGSAGKVRCWDGAKATTAAQKAELAKKKKCETHNVCLYDGKNFKGRMLTFNDEYWHNLAKYGFSNKTSSVKNNQDGPGPFKDHAYLADGRNGKGKQVKFSQGEKSASLGKFNNKASSVHG
ncbi:peptidase inhibitor family I36 protein [Streptomyces sp. NPDC041068]|uniref:peptidase inhibitor family I36 protein n=1 Tax=Streptomyces sp. NPDC041068 TaxID=3155130 RepID=UPI0033EBC9E4